MRMSLEVNIAANLLARVWNALMSFAFVPLYLHFVGAEGYGFVSLFATLLAVFGLLDFGLSLTANREIARYGVRPDERREARIMLRTFEAVYWAIALVIGLAITLLAPWIVREWIHLQAIPPEQAERGVRLMGLMAVVRWPVSLYLGVLQGMQRQVLSNAISSLAATLAGGGAVLVLWLAAPRVDYFVGWQCLVFIGQVLALRSAAWSGLALAGDRPRVQLGVLRKSARFSIGITGITLLSLVLTQLDKLMLTRLLSLKDFGYYAIASSIAGLLTTIGGAVETASFPALTSAVGQGDSQAESDTYHKASRTLAVLVLPLAIVLALFPMPLLTLYLGHSETAGNVSRLLTILALGNAFLALEFLPLSLQLANGWTSLSLWKNVVAIIGYVPLLLLLVPRLGAVGAALCWLMLTTGYLLLEIPIMHRRLLRGALPRWYVVDIGVPAALSLCVVGSAWLMIPAEWSAWGTITLIILAGILAQSICLLVLPNAWARLREYSAPALARLPFRFSKNGLE